VYHSNRGLRHDDDYDRTMSDLPERRQPRTCNTLRQPLNKFAYSLTSDMYELIEANITDVNRLRNRSMLAIMESNSDSLATSSSSHMDRDRFLAGDEDNFLYGRRCICASEENVYCPVGAYLCRVQTPNSYTYEISCEGDTQGMIMRFLLPLALFLYIFFSCLLVSSPKGKYARFYMRRLVCCWKQERYQQALGEEIDEMALQSYRRRVIEARFNPNLGRVYYDSRANPLNFDDMVPAEVNAKVAVTLKTRRYAAPPVDAGGTSQDCMICLAEFQSGERVGDLPCGHVFHVEPCLKQWIVRKNHCPLCQANDLALPCVDAHRRPADDQVPSGSRPLPHTGSEATGTASVPTAASEEGLAEEPTPA
jgi:hypothetical protein